MIQYLHCSETLHKEIKHLRRTGKKGQQIADKVQTILANIRQGSCYCNSVGSKRSKKGEQRIKNCIKYRLGYGYRLVTIRVNEHLYIPFLGSHDETDQWLERHRFENFKPDPLTFCTEIIRSQPKHRQKQPCKKTEEKDADDQYEEQLQARLEPELLRKIFRGLERKNNLTTNR